MIVSRMAKALSLLGLVSLLATTVIPGTSLANMRHTSRMHRASMSCRRVGAGPRMHHKMYRMHKVHRVSRVTTRRTTIARGPSYRVRYGRVHRVSRYGRGPRVIRRVCYTRTGKKVVMTRRIHHRGMGGRRVVSYRRTTTLGRGAMGNVFIVRNGRVYPVSR